MTGSEAKPKKKRRWFWRGLIVLAVVLALGATWAYFTFAWVFFVSPGSGGEQLGLPITTVAGNGTAGFTDGVGDAARLNKPIRFAPHGPNAVVFADINNHAIRIAHADGRVETIAGGPDKQGHRDGRDTEAHFDSPHGVATRSDGAIAVCEASGCVIRLLELGDEGWQVSTLAGTYEDDGMRDGPCEQALFDAPHAVAWGPDGALYVADIGNHRIRKIQDGRVSTVAGSNDSGDVDGGLGIGTLNWPMDIAFDANGALWIADAGEAKIRRWHPDTGLTTPFPDQELAMPHGIAITPSGHVALAEMYGHRILRLDPRTPEIATYCGTTEEGMGDGRLTKPAAVLAHAGRLWIADLGNHRIVTVVLSAKAEDDPKDR